MAPVRTAFVMEQTLGHVTHFLNLRQVATEQTAVDPTWLPVPFDVDGPSRLVPLLRSNWSVRASWRARRALTRAQARRPLDAVVFHTQVTALFSFDIMRRIPTIVSLDATPINYDSVGYYYDHRPAGKGLLDRQKYRMNQRSFNAAARIVAWSEWARRSLVTDYGVDPAQVEVIAPGAAPAYFDIGERRRASAGHSLPDGRPVRLLFVGGAFERKGGPRLLECMRGSLADRCELHLVTTDAVATQRNVYVHRGLGPNSAELRGLFAEADIFILPSMADCLAVVLMEATAAGLPIITTEIAALPEAVHPGQSGLLVPAGDTRALEHAVTALVDDPQLRQRMSRASYELACRKFDARCNGRALLDVVLQVTEAAHEQPRAA